MIEGAIDVAVIVPLDRSSGVPLHRQLYDGLREGILAGRFPVGARLPSTRGLAAELEVSRNTVTSAFSQLLVEGYLEGRVGSGTYVAGALPDEMLRAHRGAQDGGLRGERGPSVGRRLSRRGELLAATRTVTVRDVGRPRAFRPCVPALEEFPHKEWRAIAARRWRRPPGGILGYGDPADYRPSGRPSPGTWGRRGRSAARRSRWSWSRARSRPSTSRPGCCWIRATPRGWRTPATPAPGPPSPAPEPGWCPCR